MTKDSFVAELTFKLYTQILMLASVWIIHNETRDKRSEF